MVKSPFFLPLSPPSPLHLFVQSVSEAYEDHFIGKKSPYKHVDTDTETVPSFFSFFFYFSVRALHIRMWNSLCLNRYKGVFYAVEMIAL